MPSFKEMTESKTNELISDLKCTDVFFQVKMLRYGRQTVSVDVDAGVLLFDKKTGSFGIERVSHDRSKEIFALFPSYLQWLKRISSKQKYCLIIIICMYYFSIFHFFPVYQSFRLSSFRAAQPRYAWWLTATTAHRGRWRLRVHG